VLEYAGWNKGVLPCIYMQPAVAAQAKAMGQKLKIKHGEEDDEQDQGPKRKGDEEGVQELMDRDWGANKRFYYGEENRWAPGPEDFWRCRHVVAH
jgi:hypothetical protein